VATCSVSYFQPAGALCVQPEDATQFVEEVEKRRGGAKLPIFLGGQSMGGLTCVHMILMHPNKYAGLVMYSGLLDIVWTPLIRCDPLLRNNATHTSHANAVGN